VGTFHPKTIAFFIAFAPQFLAPERPYLPQAAIMILTFTGIAAVTDSLYALVASRQAQRLRSARTQRIAARTGGSVLIAAGLATALARR
jgi:threonine/homoserine/homoserine lactone efflux protein